MDTVSDYKAYKKYFHDKRITKKSVCTKFAHTAKETEIKNKFTMKKTTIIQLLFCWLASFAISAAYGSEWQELPDIFHPIKADITYYDDYNSVTEHYNILDSIENPKAYLLNGSWRRSIAIKKENKYVVFDLGVVGNSFDFGRQNINNKGNDELIIYWGLGDGGEFYSEYGSGLTIWDIDSYECLLHFQDRLTVSSYAEGDDFWHDEECYKYEVELEEMQVAIQQTKTLSDNECIDVNGEKYVYQLTESGFVKK